MATSFEGWLSSWNGWGTQAFDPNAMQGSALMTFSAIGTLTADGVLDDQAYSWTSRPARVIRKKRENDEALLLFVL